MSVFSVAVVAFPPSRVSESDMGGDVVGSKVPLATSPANPPWGTRSIGDIGDICRCPLVSGADAARLDGDPLLPPLSSSLSEPRVS